MMKIAIFFSAGIGNTILTIPLLKQLKKTNNTITGIFLGNKELSKIYIENNLLDKCISLTHQNEIFVKSFLFIKKFDIIYLDFFSSTKKNMLASLLMGKHIITNKLELSSYFKSKHITYITPKNQVHESEQYMHLLGIQNPINIQDFLITISPPSERKKINNPYIVLQLSSGNNKAKYKNWSQKMWLEFIHQINKDYKQLKIVLIGDETETAISHQIENSNAINIVNLVGKTSLTEVASVIKSSIMYVGLDSGLMHLAITQNKPTFCIWGGSDNIMYSYPQLDPKNHKIIQNKLKCHPCNAWLNQNKSKVNDPNKCPDFECLNSISSTITYREFKTFLTSLNSSC